MTSERKIAANRRNAQKSRGPRTAAGKSIASRNALRHALAAITHRQPVSASEIERFAKAFSGGDTDPSLFEQALIIADNEWVLRAIAAQKVAVVDRLRERSAIALAKGDNSLALADARFLKSCQADAELTALNNKLLEKYKDKLPPPIVRKQSVKFLLEIHDLIPLHLRIFLQDMESESASQAGNALPAENEGEVMLNQLAESTDERDESAALEEAALDLVRLDRYERRAWSRQKRAVCAFTSIKLMQRLGGVAASNGKVQG